MEGWAEGLACEDLGPRTPIGASGNLCLIIILVQLVDIQDNYSSKYFIIQAFSLSKSELFNFYLNSLKIGN